jgi:hypothetical protein
MSPTTLRKAPLSGARLVAVVTGAASLLLATLFLLLGTGLLWADSRKDDDGYFSTAHERVATTTHAIATDDLEIDGALTLNKGLYGKLRLEVDGTKPVFAGIARSRDVDAYLDGSAHATLTDLEVRPFRPHYRENPGTLTPKAPGEQSFWAASTEGAGERTLTWDVEDGDWSVVVMNADGSRGVDARVSAGASVPLVDDLGYGFSIASLVLVILGGTLIVEALRRRPRPSSPDGSASGA